MTKRIYLDNAATTKIDPKVFETMKPYFSDFFGNPSSVHSFGQEARTAVDKSRDIVAKFLNCDPMEIVFTSGGSESDNLAIRGIIENLKFKIQNLKKPHVITTAFEHHAVLHTVQDMEKEGKIEASYINPGKNGLIDINKIKEAIKDNTILISVMYVNNEIGTVQPIPEIGKMIQVLNQNRNEKIYFHTDAVQAVEYFDMDIQKLKVDLLTMTAHKIHGPKGIGVLFIKKDTKLAPMITGGEQEFRKRAGTENVPGIVGLAAALQQVESKKPALPAGRSKVKTIKRLRDKLENYILINIKDTYLNGDKEKRSPAISNISFKNAEGEAIILNLDFLGIAVSSGSACTAMSLDPSHVLTAIGVPRELSHGAIRFSLSRETTEKEIDLVIKELPKIIEKLRLMSPLGEKHDD